MPSRYTRCELRRRSDLCCDLFAFANIPPVKYRMSRRDKRKYRPKIRVGRMHWGPTRHKICVGRVPHVPHGSGAYGRHCSMKTAVGQNDSQNVTHSGTRNQWSSQSNGVMRYDRLAEKTKRAAAFKTDCSRSCSWPGIPARTYHLAYHQVAPPF